MQPARLPPPRLFIILARQAPRAVIFRRGPTEWTRLILWKTDTDELIDGQWFNGRVFERRSDLSPDGTRLIYFARKIRARTLADKEYTYAWTAISKPPYLTALALWPKGDSWHGGGLFEDNETVFLNQRPERAKPHPNHQPHGLIVRPNPNASGENDPLYSMRLTRDGWGVNQEWKLSYSYPTYYTTVQPEIRVRPRPSGEFEVQMTRRLDRFDYRESFSLVNRTGESVIDPAKIEWADWDHNGRLVLLKEGKLLVGEESNGRFALRELADFSSQKPEPMAAPQWATEW